MKTITKTAKESAKIVENSEVVSKVSSCKDAITLVFKKVKNYFKQFKKKISRKFRFSKGFNENKQFLETKQNTSDLEDNHNGFQKQVAFIINHPFFSTLRGDF